LVPEARVACALAAWINGKEEAGIAQMLVQLLLGDAGFERHIQVFGVDGDDPGRTAEVDAEAAF
jgi:hypothetical protein